MSSLAAALRPRRGVPWAASALRPERSVRRGVYLAWSLLFVNVLTFYPTTWNGLPLAVPIPSKVGKVITQGALLAALLVALMVNRRRLIRPNVFLCIVALLVLDAVLAALQAQHLVGTSYRTFRLAAFVATLWLLSPWWGRRDLLLARCHLGFISAVLGTVVIGVLISPSKAMDQGRLAGVLWPIPPTEVAHFAAVTFGFVVVLWLGSRISGRTALLTAAATGTILLLTHTRTALIAMLLGLLVASLSLFTVKARVRKLLASAGVLVAIGDMTLSGVVTAWLSRGEDTQQLTTFTGRTVVWNAVVSAPRDGFQRIFGFGLSNLSFNGLPIDSNWLGAYLDLGLAGVLICAAMLLFPLVAANFQPRSVERALGLFLVTYCLVSSFTETGLSSPSAYLLDLTLAASLLISPAWDRSPALPAIGTTQAVMNTTADRPPPAPTVLTGGRNEDRAGPQPISLRRPER
jgi:hypothetical protein